MAEHTPSRRRLLTTAAACATAASVPVVALAVPVDPHPAWLAEFNARLDHLNRGNLNDEDGDAAFWAMIAVQDRLYQTPAETVAGCRAQLAACLESWQRSTFGNQEADCLALALASLDRLAGGQAHG